MAQYKVRSGQNIYDVALTLYGSIEGIIDLLASNSQITMETTLKQGMILEYHEDFIVNHDINLWIQNKGIIVKNGEHTCHVVDMESLVKNHIQTQHFDIYSQLQNLSADERDMYWSTLFMPRMIIRQIGLTAKLLFKLKSDKHFIVDWGDCTNPEIIEGVSKLNIEHCYKGSGQHIITLYGDFAFDNLDLTEINGMYYPLNEIHADTFVSNVKVENINKLIITQ